MRLPREFWRDIARVHESQGNFTSASRIRALEPVRTAYWVCSQCGGTHRHRIEGDPATPYCSRTRGMWH
jgi:hypothetical protein